GSPGTTYRQTKSTRLAPNRTSTICSRRRTTYLAMGARSSDECRRARPSALASDLGHRRVLEEVDADARPGVGVEDPVLGPVEGRDDGEVLADGDLLRLLGRLQPVGVVLVGPQLLDQ